METEARPAQPVGAQGLRTLEEARRFFDGDLWAVKRCGIQIIEAEPGLARCSFIITDDHRNAMGAVMGGAVFTLADFALAVASNMGQPPAVTATSTIEYISSARGDRLEAECACDRSGRRMGFYTTRVTDGEGRLVALVTATVARV